MWYIESQKIWKIREFYYAFHNSRIDKENAKVDFKNFQTEKKNTAWYSLLKKSGKKH